jgi:hypothetical protein
VRPAKRKGNLYDSRFYPEPTDLNKYEWIFRQCHAGKKLVFLGGVPRPHQVEKLMRLGCTLEWWATGHDHQNGSHHANVDAIYRTDADMIFLWNRHLSHSLFYQVKKAIGQVGKARQKSGGSDLRQLVGSTLNTEEMARMFVQGEPGLPALEEAWLKRAKPK